MDSKILLGKLLQRFKDQGIAQVEGYNSFHYKRETDSAVYVLRENGNEAQIPFKKLVIGIESYQANPELYYNGPSALREFDITHVNSPIWALLHLLTIEEYR